jgi:protein-tyrosine phosphatase
MRICFVCLGNIVRSPLAENLFRQLIEEREIEGEYEVDSAGTSAFHVGEVPDGRMRSVARERGLFYSGKARQFTKNDFDNFDLILAMDRENKEVLTSLAATEHQRQKIRLLREYDPVADGELDVPDPYYGGLDGFQNVYDLVERSILGLLEALERDRDS